MPTAITRFDISLDPSVPPTAHIHPDGICSYINLNGPGASLTVDHWRSEYDGADRSPEAMVAWLRTAADLVEQAWAERRIAEQHDQLEVAS